MSGMIGSASKTLRVKEFRASGTFTVPAGVKTVEILIGGGGAAGQTTTNAGGPGQVFRSIYDVDGKSSCSVVIGAGGTAPSGAGGDSSFDGVVVAKGGTGLGFPGAPTFNATIEGLGQPGSAASPSVFGSGAWNSTIPAANSCSGGGINISGASGYCRVEWYE